MTFYKLMLIKLSFIFVLIITLLFSCPQTYVEEKNDKKEIPPYSILWGYTIGETDHEDEGQCIALDSEKNIYAAGYAESSFPGILNAGNKDIVLTKFDAEGNGLWIKLLGSNNNDCAKGIVLDENNNIYLTGYTRGDLDGEINSGYEDIFIAKFDKDGNKLWVKLLGTSTYDFSNFITLDSEKNIYITGYTNGDLDGNKNFGRNDIFIAKYDNNGNKLWVKLIGTDNDDEANCIYIDENNNLYITGQSEGNLGYQNNNGGYDVFLSKYDKDGNELWTNLFGSTNNDYSYDIKLDNDNNVYLSGHVYGKIDDQPYVGSADVFISKFDSSGKKLWIQSFGSPRSDTSYGIEVDEYGNIYTIGGTNYFYDYDLLMFKFDSSGSYLWDILLYSGTDRDDKGMDIVLDGNDILITGYMADINNRSYSQIFLAKIGQNLIHTELQHSVQQRTMINNNINIKTNVFK